MKVFVAESREKGRYSSADYHWCNDGELLMFGAFTQENPKPSDIRMFGIETRKGTTYITVKDINIGKDTYRQKIKDSIEKAFQCTVDKNGDYIIDIGWEFTFNIDEHMNELFKDAKRFEEGDQLNCYGKTLYKPIPD